MGSEDRCLKCGASRASALTSTIGCMHVFALEVAQRPIEPDPDAPLDVADLPAFWDARRKRLGKNASVCAAELRRALEQRAGGVTGENPVDKWYTRELSAAIARADNAEHVLAAAERERDAARSALAKISAIRDSIIGTQRVNWSAHIYPLVAALGEAGFEGVGYDVAHKEALTLIAERDAATSRAEQAERERDEARGFLRHWKETAVEQADGRLAGKALEQDLRRQITEALDACAAIASRAETAEGLLRQSMEVLEALAYWHEQGHVDESWFAGAKTLSGAARSHLQSLKGGSDAEG